MNFDRLRTGLKAYERYLEEVEGTSIGDDFVAWQEEEEQEFLDKYGKGIDRLKNIITKPDFVFSSRWIEKHVDGDSYEGLSYFSTCLESVVSEFLEEIGYDDWKEEWKEEMFLGEVYQYKNIYAFTYHGQGSFTRYILKDE